MAVTFLMLIWDMFKVAWNVTSMQFVRKVNLLEGFFLLDGIVNACKFLKEYVIYNASKQNNLIEETKLQEYRSSVLQQCDALYTLGTIDRYLFYGVMYCNFLITDWVVSSIGALVDYYNPGSFVSVYSSRLLFVSHCLLTVPAVQNKIFEIAWVDRIASRMIENKKIFIKYSLSKLLINHLKGLDEGISGIKNYHTLMLYHHLNYDYAYAFAKSYGFIHLLHYLRQFDVTYYYYKTIKLAYYYNSGYLFNVITKEDSLYIINIIIKEKRWNDLVKVDVVNALYSLISAKVDILQDTTRFFWGLSQFYAVWSIICILKLVNIYLNTTFLAIYLGNQIYHEGAATILTTTESIGSLKKILIAVVTYALILLNTNDLIISLVFFGQGILYIFVDELLFFIKNEKDIKKVLKHFENDVITK